jgi:CBS domain-containing protein
MVAAVVTVSPDSKLCDAVRVMLDKKIGCLPVVEDDRLVGLITETDVLTQYLKDCGAME